VSSTSIEVFFLDCLIVEHEGVMTSKKTGKHPTATRVKISTTVKTPNTALCKYVNWLKI
jgi:hypothetical protein